jgi:hypothetical protein
VLRGFQTGKTYVSRTTGREEKNILSVHDGAPTGPTLPPRLVARFRGGKLCTVPPPNTVALLFFSGNNCPNFD